LQGSVEIKLLNEVIRFDLKQKRREVFELRVYV
jgi:hypothetical protein